MNYEKDRIKFSKIMLGMADNFRDTITKEGMKMRFDMLQEFSIEQVDYAAKEIIKRRKYTKMPPIREFLDILQPKAPAVEDRATVIADNIIAHLKQYGSSKHPTLLDDHIAKHLMSTRWPYSRWAANVLESELVWWKKEFIESYRAYVSTEDFLRIEENASTKRIKLIAGGVGESI